MKMESSFVKVFGDTPINRLWEFLIDSRGVFDYSMTDISEAAGISWNTLKDIFPYFVKNHIVRETRKIGRATMYMLNENHPRSVFMIGMQKAINIIFMRGGNFKLEMKMIKGSVKTPIDLCVQESALEPVRA
jgi:hypothetical protein